MASPHVLVLRAPGVNCDLETVHAFELARAKPHPVHVNQWLDNPQLAQQYQILCLPGGFSYGDDIAAGRILASQIAANLADQLAQFKNDGKLILGICNGFQVLLELGGLFDSSSTNGTTIPAPSVTLAWNDSARFEDRWVNLTTSTSPCVFLQDITQMYLPVAHAEGKFVAADPPSLTRLEDAGQLALRYADQNGAAAAGYPANPNGSQANVAGLCDPSGRVFGLMPHPERYLDRTNHPRWTRGEGADPPDGLRIFQNAVKFFE